MAALGMPAVRQRIHARDPNALASLDDCIPETLLVEPEVIERLRREQSEWVIKYAGFDRVNQAWGGRSLQVGALHAPDSWAQLLQSSLELPWPVVAQRFTPSARLDITYFDGHDTPRLMRQGATRLRAFMLRDARNLPLAPVWERGLGGEGHFHVTVCGVHLTVSGGAVQVSESTDAVQAPVVFRELDGRSKGC
jgi:hypothetical protein